jgi:diguanylate cyclase (GGDEF)-like protein
MQIQSADRRQGFTHRIILPLAALLLVFTLAAIAGLYWIANFQTRIAIEQQARLADGAFRIQAEKLTTSAADYGFWDDAVAAIAERPDPAWMKENIGDGAEKSLGVQVAFALDPQGQPIYSHIGGKDGQVDPAAYFGAGFRRIFAAWKNQPPGKPYSSVLSFNGRVAAVAIAPVHSFTHADQPPTGCAIVFAKFLEGDVLQGIARDFELANLRLALRPADIADARATIAVGDGDKKAKAMFVWDPERPGDQLLRVVLPFMGAFLVLLALLAAFVLNFVISSAQLLRKREEQALRDPLTGLPNRTLFFAELNQALARLSWDSEEIAVLYLDLDDFKAVNDTMGHAAGDHLLIEAAHRFGACIGPDDIAARLGGDEFAILLNGHFDQRSVQSVGGTILHALSKPFHLSEGVAHIGCSIGAATGHIGIRGADLLNQADQALYRAKTSGKNAISVHADPQPQPHPQASARVA